MQEQIDNPTRSYNRGSSVRYDANCPGVVELTFMDRFYYIALTGVIVNVSRSGCLFANDRTPWNTMPIDQTEETLFRLIDEQCHVYMPWANAHRTGKVRRVRSYIIGVQFDEMLDPRSVKLISRLEPSDQRRFKPANSEKYNHIFTLRTK
ncbi:PilZ domain-containing protein [Hoeflea alexandrii]|uniref:PilZ domain-containing protein n=1 Tax=Hoeflea alexandrii TaxID=288436 RepID=A0ABT1CV84_9HYPH|nr:PilZ domain-containing protein [Hoeflea alexandrii]MCO6410119.1 hypothetical protein [Hoeflea alexandrii]MCY0153092.1 PilZ domain-containing protein [Hoeflea alexandrii]